MQANFEVNKVLAYEHLLWNKAVSRLQFEWHHVFETTLAVSVDDYHQVCCYRAESWPFWWRSHHICTTTFEKCTIQRLPIRL